MIETQEPLSLFSKLRESRRGFIPDSDWYLYNSPVSCYYERFVNVLNGQRIEGLTGSTQSPTVIDLMAPTGTIADLFEIQNKKGVGVAVSLQDLRTDSELKRDISLGISQVTGDITKPSTWKAIQEALKGQKANLIMQCAYGGLSHLPRDIKLYKIMLQKMWSLLGENGVILIQVPRGLQEDASPHLWAEKLNIHDSPARFDERDSAMFIKRTSRSPFILPAL